MPMLSRRVPLYVFLPVVVGCGIAGYVASTWRPEPGSGRTVSSPAVPVAEPPSQAPVLASMALEAVKPEFAPTPDIVPAAALPIEEIDPPTPAVSATKAAELQESMPDDTVRSAPARVPTEKASPSPTRAEPPVRVTSKARSQRASRQRTAGPPPPPTTLLNGIPIFGPVFSLLQ